MCKIIFLFLLFLSSQAFAGFIPASLKSFKVIEMTMDFEGCSGKGDYGLILYEASMDLKSKSITLDRILIPSDCGLDFSQVEELVKSLRKSFLFPIEITAFEVSKERIDTKEWGFIHIGHLTVIKTIRQP